MQSVLETIYQSVKDADRVLIGIGESFKEDAFEQWDQYQLFLKRVEKEDLKKEQITWMIPYLRAEYSREESAEVEYQRALHKLAVLLEGKNYFIVTLNTDDRIYNTNINPERITAPCGTYRYQQCCDHCTGSSLVRAEESFIDRVRKAKSLLDLKKSLCQYCNKELVYNIYTEPHYDESGYLAQWNAYQNWIGESLNKKVCVLEFGVGFQLPSIIRWPFEKITYVNQKAELIRVHDRLWQVPKEIMGRSVSYSKKPVDLFAN